MAKRYVLSVFLVHPVIMSGARTVISLIEDRLFDFDKVIFVKCSRRYNDI